MESLFNSWGGGIAVGGLLGGYLGYKVGRARPQKSGFDTEKKIARNIKQTAKDLRAKNKSKKMATGGKTKGQTLSENFNRNDNVKNIEFWNNDVIVENKGKVSRIDLDKGERINLNAKGGGIGNTTDLIPSAKFYLIGNHANYDFLPKPVYFASNNKKEMLSMLNTYAIQNGLSDNPLYSIEDITSDGIGDDWGWLYTNKKKFISALMELEETENISVDRANIYAKGGGVKKPRLKKGDSVYIYGKTWFQRSYGNTYHITKVYVNDKVIGISEKSYGYGEQYIQTGMDILWQNYTPPYKWKLSNPAWMLKNFGIKYEYEETEVSRERDLTHTDYAEGGSLDVPNLNDGDFVSTYDDGGKIDYLEKMYLDKIEEESGNSYPMYRVSVYEQQKNGGYQFAQHQTDNILEAIDFAKSKMRQQRLYRKDSMPLWASVSKFTPVRERGNVEYKYSNLLYFSEEDMVDRESILEDWEMKTNKTKDNFAKGGNISYNVNDLLMG